MPEVHEIPQLSDPVFVAMFTGWVDAGLAGIGTIGVLRGQMENPRTFARAELGDTVAAARRRPTVKVEQGTIGPVEWPEIELVAGHLGRDLVLCAGPEPATQWQPLADWLVDVSTQVGVRAACFVSGMPGPVSHRHPATVLTTVSDETWAWAATPLRPDYEGPTGFQTVLQRAMGDAGIPSYGLWAQVPPYLLTMPSPPAIAALLRKLSALTGLDVDLQALVEQSREYASAVEEELRKRPDLAQLVDQLGAEEPPEPGLDTGAEAGGRLVSDIERYLRDQPGEDDDTE